MQSEVLIGAPRGERWPLVQSEVWMGLMQWVWVPFSHYVLMGASSEDGRGPWSCLSQLSSFPTGDPLVSPGCPYWPGEFVTTASESEGPGGSEGLRVQPAGGQGHPWGDPPRPNGEALPRDHLLLPLPQPHKGMGCHGTGGHSKSGLPTHG